MLIANDLCDKRSASFYLDLLEYCPAKQPPKTVQSWCCELNHALMATIFILISSLGSVSALDMIFKATRSNSIVWIVFVFGCAFLDIISVMRPHTTIDMVTKRLYLKATFQEGP